MCSVTDHVDIINPVCVVKDLVNQVIKLNKSSTFEKKRAGVDQSEVVNRMDIRCIPEFFKDVQNIKKIVKNTEVLEGVVIASTEGAPLYPCIPPFKTPTSRGHEGEGRRVKHERGRGLACFS